MIEQEMAARLIVLETICKAGFGILFALASLGADDTSFSILIATISIRAG
jgi:hypothetical protein